MYLSMPDVFCVPVYYAEKHILNIEKIILEECNSYSNLIDELINRKEIVIGAALPAQQIPRWVRDKEFMEKYSKQKGVTLKVEVNDFDAAKQAKQVENLISQNIDVLILAPLDTTVATELVKKANKAGIKVISYEALVKNSDVDLFVAFNNIKAGQLQAKFLIEKVPKGNYIILSGTPDIGFREGAMQYIQPLANVGSIKIVADKIIKDWDPKIAYQVVKDALIANNNKIDAILAPGDRFAGAAIEALKEQGLAGKVAITGYNADLEAIRRIIEGTQSMTVFNDSRELVKLAIDSAIKLANKESIAIETYVNNGKVNVPSILLNPIVVDRYNINKVLINSGYLKQGEVYKRY